MSGRPRPRARGPRTGTRPGRGTGRADSSRGWSAVMRSSLPFRNLPRGWRTARLPRVAAPSLASADVPPGFSQQAPNSIQAACAPTRRHLGIRGGEPGRPRRLALPVMFS
ncbi:hypothetical protein I548_0663 [Mycobacterium intracellulare]|nr:hypothetical protein I548_0663 [Mycobacterium intracellulare]